MKNWLFALALAVAGTTLSMAPLEADAKRLGGGRAAGMQRQAPAKPADATPAPSQAAAPVAGAGAAAAAGKRSWMGPIAGLAAGLGLAALASHLGFGEGLANAMMLGLLAVLGVVLVRWAMRRFAGGAAASSNGMQFAGAGTSAGPAWQAPAPSASPAMPVRTAAAVDDGFDGAGFERVAKMLFIRLQAANDAGQVDDLRRFTTPELFASLRLDLQERGSTAQQTDVVQLDAQLVERTQDADQWIASVRFHGLIRESADAAAAPFDEVWHFVRPIDESADWAIAGITPQTVAA